MLTPYNLGACLAMGRENAAIALSVVSAKPAEHFNYTTVRTHSGIKHQTSMLKLNNLLENDVYLLFQTVPFATALQFVRQRFNEIDAVDESDERLLRQVSSRQYVALVIFKFQLSLRERAPLHQFLHTVLSTVFRLYEILPRDEDGPAQVKYILRRLFNSHFLDI